MGTNKLECFPMSNLLSLDQFNTSALGLIRPFVSYEENEAFVNTVPGHINRAGSYLNIFQFVCLQKAVTYPSGEPYRTQHGW
jgi:hypothetical protein